MLDVFGLVGLVLLGYGLALMWMPLAFVVVGALLLLYAFVAALPPRQP